MIFKRLITFLLLLIVNGHLNAIVGQIIEVNSEPPSESGEYIVDYGPEFDERSLFSYRVYERFVDNQVSQVTIWHENSFLRRGVLHIQSVVSTWWLVNIAPTVQSEAAVVRPSHCVNDKNYSSLLSTVGREHEDDACDGNETESQIVIVSLWHWWKEVLGISIVLAILFNVLLSYVKRKCAKIANDCRVVACFPLNDEKKLEPEKSLSTPTSTPTDTTIIPTHPIARQSSEHTFVSRFRTDFELIRKLGKGGYGVVLEARNRIDTCHYAIKIILLPFRAEGREKVMREVKALAKLDHRGIVRFYNSWLEVPPPNLDTLNFKDLNIDDISSLQPLSNTAVFGTFTSNNNSINNVIRKETGDSAVGSIKSFNCSSHCGTDIITREESNIDDDSYVVFQKTNSTKNDLLENSNAEESKEKSVTKERPKTLLNNSKVFLFIQMQLCQKDTLREWLRNNLKRDRTALFQIFVQIVNAVEYVHGIGLMHRDLKPSNIFFSPDGNVKIGDFGLVTAASVDDFFRTPEAEEKENVNPFTDKHTNKVGTRLYMSPEQIRGVLYSNKVDIFSLGVIFFEMLVPFNTEMERISILSDVRQQKFPCDFQSKYPVECDFLKQLLSNDPNERPSAEQILQNPLFIDIDEEFRLNERTARRRTISWRYSDSWSEEY